tara:strand:+ start:50 stop:328 length:279 start_codon:yes stop_codon:yes gene_type:complete
MRKPYKMKGSEFFGHGSDSPAKVTDSELLGLQSKLNHSELDYREPGWAKVAKKVEGKGREIVAGAMGGAKGAPATEVQTDHEIETDEPVVNV